jgi:wyosine [tRNA(Phe)-imidazoG37] synthetase (radical SAM superfamily)
MTNLINSKHNFLNKLLQEKNFKNLKNYIKASRNNNIDLLNENFSPISINLDLTTSCNYACSHCIDMDILNTGIKFDYEKLIASLENLIKKGLKSVIIIGGGEPTVSPYFFNVVEHCKKNKLEVGVVSNGSRPDAIKKVLPLLNSKDWIRYSLDSASNKLFDDMHLPKKKTVTLDWICENVKKLSDEFPKIVFGFSFIIVWQNLRANDTDIHENIHEMLDATVLAKKSGFKYISFKPFLDREENNSEVIGGIRNGDFNKNIKKTIRENILKCEEIQDDNFKVVRSTNLTVFMENLANKYQNQPKRCHMHYFRQVLSPLGTFSCPVYRNIGLAKVGDKNSYSDGKSFKNTAEKTIKVINDFDASKICKDVVCLYNDANWFIDDLINKNKNLELEMQTENTDSYL